MGKEPYRIVLIAVLLAMVVTSVYGQADQGRVEGIVKDVSGGLVPGVTVKIHNERTGEERTVLTADEGNYFFNGLKPSTYSIETSITGFAVTSAKFEVLVGQARQVNLTIHPGYVASSVNVESSVQENQIESGSTSMGASVDLREVQQLPINGRNLSQLYLQAPGRKTPALGTMATSVSTDARGANAIRYDSIESTASLTPPRSRGGSSSPFVYRESRKCSGISVESNSILRNLAPAPEARSCRANRAVTVPRFVFEYLRNDALDARNTFDMTKPALRMNQFGGSVGGQS